jgi:DNA polymerase III sliding clamp (beta) subunit (PCNA family)
METMQPDAQAPDTVVTVSFDARQFTDALSNVMLCAASGAHARPQLAAVLFDQDGNCARLTATDSHILATETVDAHGELAAPVLIDRDSLVEVERAAKRAKGGVPIILTIRDGATSFTVAGVTFPVRVVDADYPDWERLFPSGDERTCDEPVGLGPKYVAKLAKLRHGGTVGTVCVRMGETPLKPVTFRLAGPSTLRGVLMPLRVNS